MANTRTLDEAVVDVMFQALTERLDDVYDHFRRAPEDEVADLALNLLTMDSAFHETCGSHWLEQEDIDHLHDIIRNESETAE